MIYIKAFLIFLITFLVVDAVWISQVVTHLYAQDLSHLMADKPKMSAAVFFYLFYAAGVVWLAIKPALNSNSVSALINGAVFGGLSYATFTVTNYALLDGWTLRIVISDILWGATLTGFATWVAYSLATKGTK